MYISRAVVSKLVCWDFTLRVVRPYHPIPKTPVEGSATLFYPVCLPTFFITSLGISCVLPVFLLFCSHEKQQGHTLTMGLGHCTYSCFELKAIRSVHFLTPGSLEHLPNDGIISSWHQSSPLSDASG